MTTADFDSLSALLTSVREQLARVERAVIAAAPVAAAVPLQFSTEETKARAIIRRAKLAFDIAPGMVLRRCRADRIVQPRHAAIRVICRATSLLDKDVAQILGLKISAISHARKCCAERMESDAPFRARVTELERMFPALR